MEHRSQYSKGLVNHWDQFINWRKREKGERDFFIRHLRSKGIERVLDMACGTGFHTIKLKKAGFSVVGLDNNPNFLLRAKENAKVSGLELELLLGGWGKLTSTVKEKFDAVICLGNSFTHLMKEKERLSVILQVKEILVRNGTFVVDHRNYDKILSGGDINSRHEYYYCGDVKVKAKMVKGDLVVIKYRFKDHRRYELNLYPIRQEEMQHLLRTNSFSVNSFGDFKPLEDKLRPDYIQHIADKSGADKRKKE